MQLHNPVPVFVFSRHGSHKRVLEFSFFLRTGKFPRHPSPENGFDFLFCGRRIHNIVQCVVAQFAAVCGKEIQPAVQHFFQICKAADLHAGSHFQLGNIFRISYFFQIHCLIRPPGRQNSYRKGFVCCQLLMPFQGVRRIVCGADRIHVAHHDQSAG